MDVVYANFVVRIFQVGDDIRAAIFIVIFFDVN